MPQSPKVTVVGSINLDLVIRCEHLPIPGQTVIAESSREIPGGKGANQAVAVSRAGGDVTMIGRVGDDVISRQLIENLAHHRVHTGRILTSDHCASGIAVVAVDSSGQNAILVVPGANALVTIEDVEAAREIIRRSDIVLLQLEIPLPAVQRVIEIANSADVPVVLDPAPMPTTLPPELLRVDVICPNQHEASAIVGYPVQSVPDAHRAVKDLVSMGARRAIVTMAEKGAVLHDGQASHWIEPFPIEAIDTTAAGDAFAAALAVQISRGATMLDAAKFAAAAGAITATRLGAQPALPTRREIEQLVGPSNL
jgi:ribokinase